MYQIFFSLFILLSLTSCGRHSSESKSSSPSTTPENSPASLAPAIVTESDTTKEINEIADSSKKAFAASDYATLESIAEQYRTNKDSLPGGTPKLECFYDALSEEDLPENEWPGHLKKMAEWVKARPTSITARIALANAWINYAWKARGHEYADGVQSNGWVLFEQRTKTAHAILGEAAKLPVKCPIYWLCMQRVALNESWPLNEYDALFDDAVKNNPGYFCYYGDKVNYLLPRWFGKEGDWEAFINKAANNIGGDDGDVLYARLVWDVKRMQVYNYIYEETKISWPRAKHGFEVLHQRYPQSLSITSEYCVECCLNEDVLQMRVLFNELGGRVDLRAWLEKDRFETLRGLAFEK